MFNEHCDNNRRLIFFFFYSLTNLEALELRENLIKCLPDSFSQLTNLIRLDLGDNDIDVLVSNNCKSILRIIFLKLCFADYFNIYISYKIKYGIRKMCCISSAHDVHYGQCTHYARYTDGAKSNQNENRVSSVVYSFVCDQISTSDYVIPANLINVAEVYAIHFRSRRILHRSLQC